MNHKVRFVLGVVCLVLGFFGLFVPGIQGILLILAGLALLGYDFWKKRKIKKRGRKDFK